MKNNKELLKTVGLILVASLVVTTWWLGWFSFIFYLLGLYMSVYIVSYLFKTTSVISVMISVGGIIVYGLVIIMSLYLLYIVLSMMFNGSFWLGFLIFIFLYLLGGLLQLIPLALAYILGYPLLFMLEDLEKRFAVDGAVKTEHKEVIEIEAENINKDK